MIETSKRILTKEKLDKQLMRQTSASTFLSFRDSAYRKVIFDDTEYLGDKIDKLMVVMKGLVTKETKGQKPFKPQIS